MVFFSKVNGCGRVFARPSHYAAETGGNLVEMSEKRPF
jgi:hypothetical protein